MSRQLDIANRVSLEGVAPGWGDECYAFILPATYEDMLAADQINLKPKMEQVAFQRDLIKDHFVSGKVKVVGSADPVDMIVDDIMGSVAITDRLFMGILGTDLDPKEVRQMAASVNKPESDEPRTETPSSQA